MSTHTLSTAKHELAEMLTLLGCDIKKVIPRVRQLNSMDFEGYNPLHGEYEPHPVIANLATELEPELI